MKKEIEVKIKVDNFTELKEKLEKLGCEFSQPIFQDDTVFINYDRPFLEFTPADVFLRIRKQIHNTGEHKNILTLKQGQEMDHIEHEVEVHDVSKMTDILNSIGFKDANVNVNKHRQKGHLNDYEVCLDQVEGLGAFIELEMITDEDSKKVQNEMISFLVNLGLNEENRVMNGYDTLIYLKNNPNRNI